MIEKLECLVNEIYRDAEDAARVADRAWKYTDAPTAVAKMAEASALARIASRIEEILEESK